MRTYKASGIAPLSGVFIALFAAIIGAIVMGGVLYAVDHYLRFYLIVIFPLVAGAVSGFALSKAINAGKLRNGAVAGLLALVAAIVLVGTYHFAKYQLELKDDARQFLISKNLPVIDKAVDETTDEYLKSETGATGFVGFLQLEAQQGISITRSSSSNGLELRGVWYWIYSAVEFGVVLFVIAALAWAAAAEPFNEAQQQWYGSAQVILTAPGANAKPLETALKSGAFEEAGTLLQREPSPLPRVEFAVRQTAIKDPENVIITTNLVTQNGKNESRTEFATGLVSQAELERVLSGAVVSLEPAALAGG